MSHSVGVGLFSILSDSSILAEDSSWDFSPKHDPISAVSVPSAPSEQDVFYTGSDVLANYPVSEAGDSPLFTVTPSYGADYTTSKVIVGWQVVHLSMEMVKPPFTVYFLGEKVARPTRPGAFPGQMTLCLAFP